MLVNFIRRDLIHSLLLGLLIFSFIIDSGDPIGIRKISLLVIFFISLRFFFDSTRLSFNLNVVLSFFCLLIISCYSSLVSVYFNISFSAVVVWIIPYLSFPLFCYIFSIVSYDVSSKSLVVAGWLFSFCIMIVFVLFLLFDDLVAAFFYNLDFPGWFYIRSDGYPQVYFQSTLALVVISIYSFFNGYKKSSFVFLIMLVLCLSRFGALTVILFLVASKIFGVARLARWTYWLFWILFVSFLPASMFIYLFLPSQIVYSESSELIRFGHLLSIFNQTDFNSFLIGSGPGSFFYSAGFDAFSNNIEVSQLEIFRKYGVVGYVLVNTAFLFIQKTLIRDKKFDAQISLVAFYFVSYSNPVLLTFVFSIFIGVFLTKEKLIKYQKSIEGAYAIQS